MHVTRNTVPMLLDLVAANVEVTLGACNEDSTDDEAAAYLASKGVRVYGRRGMTRAEYDENLAAVRDAGAAYLCDMGGELIEASLGGGAVGALEATTSGLHRLRRLALPFPVFDWNSIALKDRLENRFHVGDGLWPAFGAVTGLGLFGRRVLVVGYGPVGKGIAERARNLGGVVHVADLDPLRLLEARYHGCDVVGLEEGLERCEVVVTATGAERVLRAAHFERLRDGAILLNAGHSNREIDVDGLRAWPHGDVKRHIERFDLPGRRVYLLGRGSLLNLVAGVGGGDDLFDHYTAVMLRGLTWMMDGLPDDVRPGLQPYPAALEREIAARSVALGAGNAAKGPSA